MQTNIHITDTKTSSVTYGQTSHVTEQYFSAQENFTL